MADAVAADDCYYTAMMSMSMSMLMRSKHDYSLIISEYFNVAIVINAFSLSLHVGSSSFSSSLGIVNAA